MHAGDSPPSPAAACLTPTPQQLRNPQDMFSCLRQVSAVAIPRNMWGALSHRIKTNDFSATPQKVAMPQDFWREPPHSARTV